jgi:hypothetical protein
VLVDSEGLTGNGGLIDLEEGVLGDDTTVCGDDGTLDVDVNYDDVEQSNRVPTYLFNLEDVTRDDLWSLDFLKLAITKDGGLEGKSLFQLLDNGTGLIFLDETDASIEQEQGANDTEVDPILKTCSKNSGGLVDDKG